MKHPLLALVVAELVGCSFAFVERPADNRPRNVAPECTSSWVWPVVDTVVGVSYSTIAFAAAATGGKLDPIVFLVGVLPAASAVYGFMAVHDCHQEEADFRASQAR